MSTKTSRRAVLAGLAATTTLGTVAAQGATRDLIFQMIEAHRLAYAEHFRCVCIADIVPSSDNPPGAEEAIDASGVAEYAAMIELLNTQPSTLVGVRALVQYALVHFYDEWRDVHTITAPAAHSWSFCC